jgi:hypothetical protein
MTEYRVRNQWWEGVIEADEIKPSFGATGDVWMYFYGEESESPMGSPLLGVVASTVVAVDQAHLLEDTLSDGLPPDAYRRAT